MSEYPEDVMKVAREIVENINADFTVDGRVDDAYAEREEARTAQAIARAIMAEREWAAKTAERFLVFADTTSRSDVEIPAAIRRGGSE